MHVLGTYRCNVQLEQAARRGGGSAFRSSLTKSSRERAFLWPQPPFTAAGDRNACLFGSDMSGAALQKAVRLLGTSSAVNNPQPRGPTKLARSEAEMQLYIPSSKRSSLE